MKINLGNVKVKRTISGDHEAMCLYKDIAEVIYKNATTLEIVDFATRLFNCGQQYPNDIEITESERQLIILALNSFPIWIKCPVMDILEGVK